MVYDWIVIGNGITGAAASYELAKLGGSVLLVERHDRLQGATRHSYGGVAYWSATTPLQQQLCQEGIERHRQFTDELGAETGFQERDLLLTVPVDADPEAIAQSFAPFTIPPVLVSRDTACEMEPLLNPEAIAAALTVRHGHVDPEKMVQAYNHGFSAAGGTFHLGQVTEIIREGDRITGITTTTEQFLSNNILVCAGGWVRHFLNLWGIPVHQYFTHAESIECPNPNVQFNTFILSAITLRYRIEANASHPDQIKFWEHPNQEICPPILDVGALQFSDGQVRMGQISRILTDPTASIDAAESERAIRSQVGHLLPCLQSVPGVWNRCIVAFSGDNWPLIGPLQPLQGIYLFSGFSHPFVFVPPLAQRFAAHVSGSPDSLIQSMRPDRFTMDIK